MLRGCFAQLRLFSSEKRKKNPEVKKNSIVRNIYRVTAVRRRETQWGWKKEGNINEFVDEVGTPTIA